MQLPDTSFQGKVWYALTAALFMVAVAAVFAHAASYILVIIAGGILAVLATQLTAKFAAWFSAPWTVAFAISWMLIIGVPFGLLLLSFPDLQAQFSSFDAIIHGMQQTGNQFADTVPGGEALLQQVTSLDMQTILQGQFGGTLFSIMSGVVGVLVILIIGILGSYDPKRYLRTMESVVPTRMHERTRARFGAVATVLSWWIVGRLSSMLLVTALTYVGLLVLGAPVPFLLAVLAGLFSFVPNIGPVLSAVPAVLVALTVGAGTVLAVVLLYLAVQTIESYGITPFIQQWAIEIPPAALIALQVIFGVLFGIIGVILAGPLAAIAIGFFHARSREIA